MCRWILNMHTAYAYSYLIVSVCVRARVCVLVGFYACVSVYAYVYACENMYV